eukprot:GSChrysophyteH1.ASY1.ANO1.2730.1 assembled CDS
MTSVSVVPQGPSGAMPMTALLCATSFWLFAEQNLMAPSLSAVAAEFGFTDEEKDLKLGGEVSIGFFLVGGICGLLVGYLTDTATEYISRTKLFAIVVLLGKFGCLGTYYCTSFPQLLVCRAVTGVAIGGASPIIYSVLGDLWGAHARVLVATMIGVSMSFGAAFGMWVAALLAPTYGWRYPFLIIAWPALLCAVLLLYARDPSAAVAGALLREGDVEAGAGAGAGADIFGMRTAWLVYAQGIFGCIPWAILGVYFNDFLQHDLQLSVHLSTILMTSFGVGAGVGQIGGGFWGQRLYNTDPRYQTVLMGLTTIVGALPLVLIINSTHDSLAGSGAEDAFGSCTFYVLGLFFISGLTAAVTGPNVRSVLQNITTTKNRGLAFSLYVLCDDVGKGAGPYFVARLIAWTHSRKEAFDIGILSWIISGSLCLCMWATLVKDSNRDVGASSSGALGGYKYKGAN